jgi:predicted O-methyltransferase YrrM
VRPSTETLNRLLAAGPALPADAWSLDDAALAVVIAEIDGGRRTVVECGSGRSTVVIARFLRELGDGSVHSLEHDPAWAQLTRMRLAAEGLAAIATVIEAPLSAHPLAPAGCRWYAPWALRELPEGLDLLLVDGPPAGEEPIERSRYPALPALADRLAPGAVVILDDVGRAGERWVLGCWEAEHTIRFERRLGDGVAIGVCCAEHRVGADTEERKRTSR